MDRPAGKYNRLRVSLSWSNDSAVFYVTVAAYFLDGMPAVSVIADAARMCGAPVEQVTSAAVEHTGCSMDVLG